MKPPAAIAVLFAVTILLPHCGESPPEVSFAEVRLDSIVSTIETNGRIEPETWMPVSAGREGIVRETPVSLGSSVRRGQLLAALTTGDAEVELDAAQARIEQARTELAMLEEGGSASALAAIESDLEAARLERDSAAEELAAIQRLERRGAATALQVSEAAARLKRADLRISALENKRATLVSKAERSDAKARLRQAQADARRASRRIALARIESPLDGILYRLEVRAGEFLQPGALVAHIGQMDRMKAFVYVDEPELGQVSVGMPVEITWDALPGRSWEGVVERVPAEVVALGTRQVGEVVVFIDNPGRSLPPQANINATIRSSVSENVPVIPKEALQRRETEVGVYVLGGDVLRWRPVELGVSNITHAEVLSGLSPGEKVALPGETPLADGMAVRPR